jgi:hypothetical protein
MDSPLVVVRGVPAEMHVPVGAALIVFAERLRTFNIPVSRKLAEEQLELDRLETERPGVLRAQAEAVAELMRFHARNRSLTNLSELEYLAPMKAMRT